MPTAIEKLFAFWVKMFLGYTDFLYTFAVKRPPWQQKKAHLFQCAHEAL